MNSLCVLPKLRFVLEIFLTHCALLISDILVNISDVPIEACNNAKKFGAFQTFVFLDFFMNTFYVYGEIAATLE